MTLKPCVAWVTGSRSPEPRSRRLLITNLPSNMAGGGEIISRTRKEVNEGGIQLKDSTNVVELGGFCHPLSKSRTNFLGSKQHLALDVSGKL